MSHEILYRTLFVRLSDDTFVPCHEHGSNNVAEVQWNGRQRRERKWSNFLFDQKPSYTREEVAARIDEIIEEECKSWVGRDNYEGGVYTREEVLEHFSFFSCIYVHNKPTNAKQFKSYFLNACDHSIAFEDLGCVELHVKHDGGNEEITSEEQVKTLEGCDLWLSLHYVSDSVYEKAHPKRERKPAVPPKEGYAVRLTDYGRYLVKFNARSLRYNYDLDYCRIYRTRKQADDVCAKIQSRYAQCADAVPVAVRTNPDTNKIELAGE